VGFDLRFTQVGVARLPMSGFERRIRSALLHFGVLLSVGAAAGSGLSSPLAQNLETFDAVWQRVNSTYYDPEFGGLDWRAIGETYRKKAHVAKSPAALRKLIREMLFELGESHLYLASSELDAEFVARPWMGGSASASLSRLSSGLVFDEVVDSGPAYVAGLRAGDTLLSIDGNRIGAFSRAFRRQGVPARLGEAMILNAVVSRLMGQPGDVVRLRVRGARGGVRRLEVELAQYAGEKTPPIGNFGSMPLALRSELKENGVAYLSFSIWMPVAMPRIRELIGSMGEGSKGLVIDLRGNPGGLMMMAGGLGGLLFSQRQFLGVSHQRQGHVNLLAFPQKSAWEGKVAILVDRSSASTSEVFALSLQEIGRARVFGSRTPGLALPSLFFDLPSGDRLQVPMGDFRTPSGARVEGNGVLPDELVENSPVDFLEGRDRVVQAAEEWILASDPDKP